MNFIVDNMISIILLSRNFCLVYSPETECIAKHPALPLHKYFKYVYDRVNNKKTGFEKKQITQQKAWQFPSALEKYNTAF